MCLKKSFEDPPTPAVGDYVARGVSGFGAARLCNRIFASLGLSLPGPAARRSGGAAAHERDRGGPECAMASRAFISCCGAKAGATITNELTAFTRKKG